MFDQLNQWLSATVSAELASILTFLILILLIFVVSFLVNRIAKRYLLSIVARLVRKSKNRYDDVFLEKHVFDRLSHLAPVLAIMLLAPSFFPQDHWVQAYIFKFSAAYLYLIGGLFLSALLTALGAIYEKFDSARHRPVKGYVQACKIMIALVVAVLVVSEVMGKSPVLLLSGIGALTAVLLLIFKDPILGVVASVQLSTNDMVRPGDWITVPNANADGDVVDVTLTTVKVQNWDKTITHVPIYSLITNAFINWRGMSDSGGRRIKRSLFIDMGSIRFCDTEMLAKFEKIRLISGYIHAKREELAEHHRQYNVADDDLLNGRRLTNLGTFRQYMVAYLRNHPKIHKEMTFLVRYLPCTAQGLPVEIYVFSNDQRWAFYEAIQADIFDHLLAILPEFGLVVFQNPTGSDVRRLSDGLTATLASDQQTLG